MTVKNYINAKETPEPNEYRQQLLENLEAALSLQKAHKDEATGQSPYDKDVRKAIFDLMIESSKESLAERARQTVEKQNEVNRVYQAQQKEEAERLAKAKKEDEERTPYLAPLPESFDVSNTKHAPHRKELIEMNTKLWLQSLNSETEKLWKAKDDKFRAVYDRLILETRERLAIEAANPNKTDAEYDDLVNAQDAESNVIMLPSSKKTETKDLDIIHVESKPSLWKRFKLWLISKLQD